MSRLLRRSGVALYSVALAIDWQPDTIVQVGVGLNCHEIDVMREAWPQAVFIGFEPHPGIVKSISSSYPGLLHQVALGDRTGTATLYAKTKLHKDGSSLFPHTEKHEDNTYAEIEVPIQRLDDTELSGTLGRILFWLDCEGAELSVLKGAEQFVERVEVINVEMTGKPPGEGWCDTVDLHKWLVVHGFYRLHIHTQRAIGGQNDAIYVRPHLFREERCCCPCEVERYRRNFLPD